MPRIELTLQINAPPERVFDLARSIDLHTSSLAGTGERAVTGVVTGLIGLNDEVTWEARHFGIRQRLTARITQFDPPAHFADTMVRGAFRRFEHHHYFEPLNGGTQMRDVFDYESPLGILGRLADILFLKRYMRSLLAGRNQVIKATAESELWRWYLTPP